MSQMLKSSGAMGIATLLSRILGVVRESLYAGFMGATWIAGAFKLAFTIPNLFRRLLGEGALTAAFIPIFKEKERTAGEKEMWHAANAVISGLILSSAAIIVLVLLSITAVLHFDTTGAWQHLQQTWMHWLGASASPLTTEPGVLKPETRLMLELLRIMFPYMLLVCLAAVFMGMLNARGYFFIPAMGATVLNLSLIVIVLFFAPRSGITLQQQIFALAFGVLFAGAAQTAYQVPTLYQEGFSFRWVSPFGDETVRQVLRKMIPGMMGVAAFQLNVLITNSIAWTVDPRIVASFDYAVRLMEFPQGLFGISLATYLLPTLTGMAAEKNYAEFRSTLKQAAGYLLFGNTVAAVLLIVLAKPIVRLLFEHGKFQPIDTDDSSIALICLAPSLIAYSLVNIFARAFYALGDTKTPMKVSSVCLVLNTLFVAWLIRPFAQGGLGIANTVSSCFNLWLLHYALRRKIPRFELSALIKPISWTAAAALAAGLAAWSISSLWENQIGHTHLPQKIGAVFLPAAAAALVYFGITLAARVPQAHEMIDVFLLRLRQTRDRRPKTKDQRPKTRDHRSKTEDR